MKLEERNTKSDEDVNVMKNMMSEVIEYDEIMKGIVNEWKCEKYVRKCVINIIMCYNINVIITYIIYNVL